MFCGASVKMWLFVVNNLCLLHFVLVALWIILFSHMARRVIIEVSTYKTSVR